MKRIELIGPAGVGKSTLYNSLLKIRKSSSQWLTTKEANFNIVSHLLSSRKKMSSLLYKPQLHVPLITGFINRSILKNEYKVAIYERDKEWREFIYSVLQFKLEDESESVKILYRYNWLLSRLEEAALLEKYFPDNVVIIDESICQKIWPLILPLPSNSINEAGNSLYRICPTPNGIIHITCSPDVIFSRLKNREANKDHWMIGFKGLSDKSLYEQIEKSIQLTEICSKVMRERGVSILEIDAELNKDEQVKKVNSFIHSFVNRR